MEHIIDYSQADYAARAEAFRRERREIVDDRETDLYEEVVSRNLWHEVALRKQVAPSDREHLIVEAPPATTERFLQEAFDDWTRSFIDKKLDLTQEREVLLAFNKSLRATERTEDSWAQVIDRDIISHAVKAFRALIANQPSWIDHIDTLLDDRGQSWADFLETSNGRRCLEVVNRCAGLTSYPLQSLRDQLARRGIVVKHETIYRTTTNKKPFLPLEPVRSEDLFQNTSYTYQDDSVHISSAERQALNENDVAHAEGVEVRRLHDEAFHEVAERAHLLAEARRGLNEVLTRMPDGDKPLMWQGEVRRLAARSGELHARIDQLSAQLESSIEVNGFVDFRTPDVIEYERATLERSLAALKVELAQTTERMHLYRNVGRVVGTLVEAGMSIDKTWSFAILASKLDRLMGAVQRHPFKAPAPQERYAN